MTTMAAMLGALPLMIGWGVGSELRHPSASRWWAGSSSRSC
jgi:multidrug efflux pump subunit AcrB